MAALLVSQLFKWWYITPDAATIAFFIVIILQWKFVRCNNRWGGWQFPQFILPVATTLTTDEKFWAQIQVIRTLLLQRDARYRPLPLGKISKSFVTLFWHFFDTFTKGLDELSPFVKVSKKCQKSVTKDFEIFPGGDGSVRLAVTATVHSGDGQRVF